jgi:hypothetical protein
MDAWIRSINLKTRQIIIQNDSVLNELALASGLYRGAAMRAGKWLGNLINHAYNSAV